MDAQVQRAQVDREQVLLAARAERERADADREAVVRAMQKEHEQAMQRIASELDKGI